MKAKEFLENNVINLQQRRRERNLPVFNVSYDDLYRNFTNLWSTGDEWGDTMGTLFAIADELYYRGEGPPAHWNYNPGISSISKRKSDHEMSDEEKYNQAVSRQQNKTEDDNEADWMDLEHVDTPTLEKFGEFLINLQDKLEAEGKDY